MFFCINEVLIVDKIKSYNYNLGSIEKFKKKIIKNSHDL